MTKLYQPLIVDDEKCSAELLARYLSRYNNICTPKIVSNLNDALNALYEQSFDLVFFDVNLPDGDSIVFSKSMFLDIPIIIVTRDPGYALEAYDLSAVDYLIKPVSFQRFDKAITRVLEILTGRKYLDSDFKVNQISDDQDKLVNILSNRFCLTKTESFLCKSILEGKTPDEIANTYSITKNTYKSHMRRIFSKTIGYKEAEIKTGQGKLQRLTLFLMQLQNEGY